MTWVKLSDTFARDPRWDQLDAEALATHVAAMCECAALLTDGRITRKSVRRLPIATDPETSAKDLVRTGLWVETDDGYEIVGWLADQLSASDVMERLETKRQYDREFQRDLRRAKPAGKSVYEWRKIQAKQTGITVDEWLEIQRGQSYDGRTTSFTSVVTTSCAPILTHPDPSHPIPTRRDEGMVMVDGEGIAGDPGNLSADAAKVATPAPPPDETGSRRPSTYRVGGREVKINKPSGSGSRRAR